MMWICPHCQHENGKQFDLCSKCGSSTSGRIDRFYLSLLRWRKRAILFFLFLPILYCNAYLFLGTTRLVPLNRTPTAGGKRDVYHLRSFNFDPWIFKPLAYLEHKLRGKDCRVVIKDGRYRVGEPWYSYGPDR